MKKKYILEIPADEVIKYSGAGCLFIPYEIAGKCGYIDTGLVMTPYTEPDLEQIKRDYDAWYEKGLADAWECARKITGSVMDGCFNYNELNVLFGSKYPESIINKYSASEAIKKIRQYEQEKEEIIDPDKNKVEALANDIGIHKLYALVKEIRGE